MNIYQSGTAMYKKLLVCIGVLMLSACSHHHRVNMPQGCLPEGYHYAKDLLVLHLAKNTQPQLFILHNVSQHKIFIDHFLWHDPGASAGWSSVIAPGKWSAIILNRTKFPILCQKMGHDYVDIECVKVLAACQYPNIVVKAKFLQGASFWVAENMDYPQLLKRIQMRHIAIEGESVRDSQ